MPFFRKTLKPHQSRTSITFSVFIVFFICKSVYGDVYTKSSEAFSTFACVFIINLDKFGYILDDDDDEFALSLKNDLTPGNSISLV